MRQCPWFALTPGKSGHGVRALSQVPGVATRLWLTNDPAPAWAATRGRAAVIPQAGPSLLGRAPPCGWRCTNEARPRPPARSARRPWTGRRSRPRQAARARRIRPLRGSVKLPRRLRLATAAVAGARARGLAATGRPERPGAPPGRRRRRLHPARARPRRGSCGPAGQVLRREACFVPAGRTGPAWRTAERGRNRARAHRRAGLSARGMKVKFVAPAQ